MRDGEANDRTYNSTEGGETVVAAVAVRFYQNILILKNVYLDMIRKILINNL